MSKLSRYSKQATVRLSDAQIQALKLKANEKGYNVAEVLRKLVLDFIEN